MFRIIADEVAELVSEPEALRILLAQVPGWEDKEIDAQVATWLDEQKRPVVAHGYARVGGRFPSYNIVMAGEGQDQQYLGQSFGLEAHLDEAKALVEQLERALGKTVRAGVERWKMDYAVYVYAEHPEVCLSCYNVLRSIFLGSQAKLLEEGAELPAETPTFSGLDLTPMSNYQPDNMFVRQFNVSLFGHILVVKDKSLGPFALGRGTRVSGLHVANNIKGVVGGITPVSTKDVP